MKKTNFCKGWELKKNGRGKWTPVLLPHDAMQMEERTPDAPSGSAGAYYLGGCYEYRKKFFVPGDWKDRYISLVFEGVYPSAKVFLNGKEIGGCTYGYSQFEVPLGGTIPDSMNEVSVIVDNSNLPNSRWYTGAGIYRPVWLIEGNVSHISWGGIRITTLSWEEGKIRVETSYEGKGTVFVEILDGTMIVASKEGEDITVTIPEAKLWDADHPYLYTCRIFLKDGIRILDWEELKFGVRQIFWGTEGFFINGNRVLLKGGCIHHDNGILGARSFKEAEWRRIRRLKEYGFNAIRSAHNPICMSALEACDALGMYVMDESWDMWEKHKTVYDYAGYFKENWKKDISYMILKDYNHPSVIMYSIGNEVTEPSKPEGVQLARDIFTEVKKRDTTRPVTAGINITLLLMAEKGILLTDEKKSENAEVGSTEFNEMADKIAEQMLAATASPEGDTISSPVLDMLDIAGYNYASIRYENEPFLHPQRIVVGSETYPQDLAKTWPIIEKSPWLIGDFMWAGWDYMGEVGIGSWVTEEKEKGFAKPYPYKLADTGALDILGNDTAEAGMAAIIWDERKKPYIAVKPILSKKSVWYPAAWRGSNGIPSWSWKGCENRLAEVEIYTKAVEAELFLNGVSQGRKTVADYKALFTVPYNPGELKAVAYYQDGSRLESCLISADERIHIAIEPEGRIEVGHLLFVNISLRGSNGEIECCADETLQVSVSGGKLLAFGSANPKTEEVFHTGIYTTYYGRSLAVILVESNILEIYVKGTTMQNSWKSKAAEALK